MKALIKGLVTILVLSLFLVLSQEGIAGTIVVDPGRDIFTYLKVAKEKQLMIKGVLLTHSHADFVTGHSELAARAGCTVYISKRASAGYPHVPLQDGSPGKPDIFCPQASFGIR